MNVATGNLNEVFAVLKPDQSVQPATVTPTLFEELDTTFAGFKNHTLVAVFDFADDWPTWEIHPAGDEVVVLLSGRATMVLRTGSGDVTVDLEGAGSYLVVPRDTWHTARVSETTKMLFITPGEGTENVEDPGPIS